MIYIGTSGYYYKNWVGEFYPSSLKSYEFFDYYSKVFNTLELNSTFYRIPTKSTLNSWKYKLKKKENFKLSIKAHKSLTHRYRLKNIDEIKNYVNLISVLDSYIGAVLFQLPPSLKYDIEVLINFAKIFDNQNIKVAIEFRNESWYRIETYTLLNEKNIAIVWHDYNQELICKQTADFIYVRLHGSQGKYKGSYEDEFFKNLKSEFNSDEIYVYFNNTDDNSAFKDALRAKEIFGI